MTLLFKDGTTLDYDRIVAFADQVFFVKSGSEFYLVNKNSIEEKDAE